jgi:type VI secretion system secreted protein Hcp
MVIFGKITTSISGLPTSETNDGKIQITMFSFETFNSGGSTTGGGGGAGKADRKPLVITRPVGTASALFFRLVVTGQHVQSFAIEAVTKDAKGKNKVTRAYTLEDVTVIDHKQSPDEGGKLMEEVTLQYNSIKIEDFVANTTVSWNFKTNSEEV